MPQFQGFGEGHGSLGYAIIEYAHGLTFYEQGITKPNYGIIQHAELIALVTGLAVG